MVINVNWVQKSADFYNADGKQFIKSKLFYDPQNHPLWSFQVMILFSPLKEIQHAKIIVKSQAIRAYMWKMAKKKQLRAFSSKFEKLSSSKPFK